MNQSQTKTIGEELQMAAFESEFQKAYLNLIFTANWLSIPVYKALKVFDLTTSQYNVLRILRGHKELPMSAIDIQSRMVYPNSNVSRILEKLQDKGLIESNACAENRRRNNVFITQKGIGRLEQTNNIAQELFEKMALNISLREARQLNEIVDKLRH